jgi:hypothetical protein
LTAHCTATLRVAASALPPRTALVALRAGAREAALEHWPSSGAAAADFDVELPLEMRSADLFVYELDLGAGRAALAGTVSLPACEDATLLRAAPRAAAAAPVISLLYEGWQAFAANATAYVQSIGGAALSVEDVIRSEGNLTLADVWAPGGASALTASFYWQEQPLLGWYCLYRKRWNEAVGILPDCANISGTIDAQTDWFAEAGVDFVTADGTNLCTPSAFADAIQTRPMEVLAEEFVRVRAAGRSTPAIVAWQRAVTGCTLHQQVLDSLYNNATLSAVVYRDPASGKKVFFVPDQPDAAIVAEIESNGGRNDVLVQEMWALFVNSSAPGRWAFESPCTVALPGGGFGFTTSVMGRGRGASGCGQLETEGSALGSAIAVSPSYQESYGSVPFSAANKFDGLTFKRQYATIVDNAARRLEAGDAAVLPDNVYHSSWNEYLSQPQANPWAGDANAFSMGMPWDLEGRKSLWVDSFGTSLSRDIEPSVHGGSVSFDVMKSCLRVVRLLSLAAARSAAHGPSGAEVAALFGARALNRSSAAACAVAGELCCEYNETAEGFVAVSALAHDGGDDALVTADPAEVARLACPGCGWTEVCNGYGGPTDFCVDNSGAFLRSAAALQGPFVLRSGGCGLPAGGAAPAPDPQLPGRVPVVRCYDGKRHFVAGAAACPAPAALETPVGCADAKRSSNMPRALRACSASAANGGRRYHVLDVDCEPGDADDAGVIGFVH